MIQAQIVDQNDPQIYQAIWEILVAIDQDFVPPLSNRNSTTTSQFDSVQAQEMPAGPTEYFNEILQQTIILAKQDQTWVGLFSFRHQYLVEPIRSSCPCNYVTTVGVLPGYRGIGVARSMYAYALTELPAPFRSPAWATRTWSSNDDHIRLLNDLGFQAVDILKHHRAPGIHTIYFFLET